MKGKRARYIGESSNQPPASGGLDYICHIPERILHHILSFLPLEYYLTMRMVTRKWKYLLHEAPVLTLDENKMGSKGRFSKFVNHIFANHSGCAIDYLCFSFQYDPRTEESFYITRWLRFLMTKDIEKLELSFSGRPKLYYKVEDLEVTRIATTIDYELPLPPFYQPIFRRFKLTFCKFKASKFRKFANLKELCLSDVKVEDSSIRELVLKCPVLENLILERCSVYEKFFVSGKNLEIKNLSVLNCVTQDKAMYKIDISAPQLIELVIKGRYLEESRIRNATNLISCSINIDASFTSRVQGNILALLLIDLRHCHSLALNSWCIQVLAMLEVGLRQQLLGSFTNLSKLKLKFGCVKQELPGIILLLQCCPILETLVLSFDTTAENLSFGLPKRNPEILPGVFLFEEDEFFQNQPLDLPGLQNKLTNLLIYWYMGKSIQKTLMEFILTCTPNLRLLSIFNDWDKDGAKDSTQELIVLNLIIKGTTAPVKSFVRNLRLQQRS